VPQPIPASGTETALQKSAIRLKRVQAGLHLPGERKAKF